MKKLFFSSLALLFFGGEISAQSISVPDVYAAPGQTVAFVVNLQNGKDNTYKALQFDAEFPNSGFTTTGAYTVSGSWAGVSANIGNVNGEGVASIPFASENLIQGANVNYLVSVSFKVDEAVEAGDYPVTLKNIFLGYNMNDKDFPAEVSFKVHVQSDVNVILDENSPLAPQASGDAVDIKVFRTIKANTWSTICLPFRMTNSQWKEVFGDDAEIRRFASYEKVDDAIAVKFGNALTSGAFIANRPYLIKTTKDISSFTVNSTITVTAAKDEAYKELVSEDDEEYVTLGYTQGIYQAGSLIPAKNLFMSNNKIFYSTGLTQSQAFRASFWFKDVLPSYASGNSRILMVFDDSDVTAIKGIYDSPICDSQIYDLGGRKIANSKSVNSKLQRGLYIQNGKKIIIK